MVYGDPDLGYVEATNSNMFGGILAILSSAPFFLAGFETIPQGVEDAGGDIKSVGKTVVLSVALACIFYAILLFCFGYAWSWQEFATPTAVGGEMTNPAAATMLKMLYGGICGSDLGSYRGANAYVSYPRIPGHELAAEIVEIDDNDRGLKPRHDRDLQPLLQLRHLLFLPPGPGECLHR